MPLLLESEVNSKNCNSILFFAECAELQCNFISIPIQLFVGQKENNRIGIQLNYKIRSVPANTSPFGFCKHRIASNIKFPI